MLRDSQHCKRQGGGAVEIMGSKIGSEETWLERMAVIIMAIAECVIFFIFMILL